MMMDEFFPLFGSKEVLSSPSSSSSSTFARLSSAHFRDSIRSTSAARGSLCCESAHWERAFRKTMKRDVESGSGAKNRERWQRAWRLWWQSEMRTTKFFLLTAWEASTSAGAPGSPRRRHGGLPSVIAAWRERPSWQGGSGRASRKTREGRQPRREKKRRRKMNAWLSSEKGEKELREKRTALTLQLDKSCAISLPLSSRTRTHTFTAFTMGASPCPSAPPMAGGGAWAGGANATLDVGRRAASNKPPLLPVNACLAAAPPPLLSASGQPPSTPVQASGGGRRNRRRTVRERCG